MGQVVGCVDASALRLRGRRSASTLAAKVRWRRTSPASVSSMSRYANANQHRNTDSLRLRTRDQHGLQAAHIGRDEVMGVGVDEPTNRNEREASEALVKLAAGRLSLHSPTHSYSSRIEATRPTISGQKSSNRTRAGSVASSHAARIRTESGLHVAHPDHSRLESRPGPNRIRPT